MKEVTMTELDEIVKNLTEEHIIKAIEKYSDELLFREGTQNNGDKYILYIVNGSKYRFKETIRYANNKILKNFQKLDKNKSEPYYFDSGDYEEFFKDKFGNSTLIKFGRLPKKMNKEINKHKNLVNVCDTKEQHVKELLPKREVGLELLNNFVEYSEKYKNNIGVYLICIKENKVNEIIDELDEKIQTKIKSNIQANNNKLLKSKFKNLFYIGRTDKFGDRGHDMGKSTSFCRSLICCFDSEYNKKKSKDRKKNFSEYKKVFLNSVSCTSWKEFFNDYFDMYVLPLSKASTTLCAESTLISIFQPPINKDGCDENIFVTSD